MRYRKIAVTFLWYENYEKNFFVKFYGTEILLKKGIFMLRYGTVPRHTAKNRLRYHKLKVVVRREKNYGTANRNNVVP